LATRIKAIRPARVPPEYSGIQVNYCKNPVCKNYGVPAVDYIPGQKRLMKGQDNYLLTGGGSSVPVLKCKLCGEFPPVKSNLAIAEELNRMLDDLRLEPEPSCPDEQCANHAISVNAGN